MRPAQRAFLRPQVPPQPAVVTRSPAPPGATLARLGEVAAALPPTDGIAVCCRVLLSAVQGTSGAVPADPTYRHLARSAAVLAERLLGYVAAHEAGETVPACWQPLFRLRHHPQVTWAQFAFAGLNAHFGHDVPLLLAPGGTGRAPKPRQPDPVEREFHRMVGLLTRVEESARDVLAEEREPLTVTEPLAHLAGAWNAERAQRDAWASCQLLRHLSETPAVAAEFTRQLDVRTGLTGWLLLTPLDRQTRQRR